MSAVTTTSAISVVPTSVTNARGRKVKSRTYTSTRVTGPTGNPPTYATEIIRYDDAKGNNPTVIGTRDNDGKTSWNDNATPSNKRNATALNEASANQVNSMSSSLATTAQQKAALNKSSGQGNQAQGSGDNESTPSTSNDTGNGGIGGSATEADPGTRNNFNGPTGPLIFPTSLSTESRDVIKFNMMKYRPSGFGKGQNVGRAGTRKTGTIIGSAMLPIPGGISDTSAVSWGSGSMDPLQAAGANIMMSTMQGNVQEGATATGDLLNALKDNPDVKAGLQGAITGAATGLDSQAMQRGMGMVMNPNMELLFNGPDLRSFGFSFTLAPRSAVEARAVISIIRFFKQGMAPIRSKSNFFLKAPHTFQIEYLHKGQQHKYLNKFKECALQNATVQYTPDGTYNTYTDGVMVSYSLQLSFNELEPIYNDDYGNGFDEIGF